MNAPYFSKLRSSPSGSLVLRLPHLHELNVTLNFFSICYSGMCEVIRSENVFPISFFLQRPLPLLLKGSCTM